MYLSCSNKSFILCGPQHVIDWILCEFRVETNTRSGASVIGERSTPSQGSEWSIQRLKLTLMKCLLSRFTPILLELFNREVTAWEGQSGCESVLGLTGSVYQELMWSGPGQWQSIILTLCASDRQDSGHVRMIVFMWWVHMNTTQLLWNSWFYLALFTLLWFVFHI